MTSIWVTLLYGLPDVMIFVVLCLFVEFWQILFFGSLPATLRKEAVAKRAACADRQHVLTSELTAQEKPRGDNAVLSPKKQTKQQNPEASIPPQQT